MMIVMLGISLAPLAGCVVAPAGPGYYHRQWVAGYYGPYGVYHPGHWN
jgi:hypothetical protein